MGKIKSKLMRRTATELKSKGIAFTEIFSENKRILGNLPPGKKIRNQIAGLLAQTVKADKIREMKLQKSMK